MVGKEKRKKKRIEINLSLGWSCCLRGMFGSLIHCQGRYPTVVNQCTPKQTQTIFSLLSPLRA
jgi:hypothetical protein